MGYVHVCVRQLVTGYKECPAQRVSHCETILQSGCLGLYDFSPEVTVLDCRCIAVALHLRLGLQSFLIRWADLGTYDPFLVHDCHQCSILSI